MPRLSHLLAASNAVLLGALIWTSAHSQPQPPVAEILRARLIELVDESGRTRAQLHLGVDGGGNLRLYGGNGEVRVKLGATAEGGGLILMDTRTEPAVLLAADARGPALTLTAPGGRESRTAP
jgi:hypothetical protein